MEEALESIRKSTNICLQYCCVDDKEMGKVRSVCKLSSFYCDNPEKDCPLILETRGEN